MSIGYAVLNRMLNITGTSKITTNFSIQVVAINEKVLGGLAETVNKSFSSDSALYSVNIQVPGDGAIYEIVVENKGTISGIAKIDDDLASQITMTDNFGIGVWAVSKKSENFNNFNEFGMLIDDLYTKNPSGEATLAPGEKAYYYAGVILDLNSTTLPSQKNFTNETKLTFTSIDNSNVNTGTTAYLSDVLLEDTAVVTSGPGLYLTDNVILLIICIDLIQEKILIIMLK